VFEENYRSRNPNATQSEVNTYLSQYFEGNEVIFKDYTSHTMRIFYMERGAGASNLHMRFNLSYVTPGHVTMKKEVTGSDDIDFDLVEYPYQIWYISEEDGQEKLLTSTDANINVTYQNSTQKVKYSASYTPPNCDEPYDSVYFLHPKKSVEIHFPSDAIQYKIIECGINQEVYDHVYVNDVEITGESIGNTNRRYYDSGWISVKDRPNVNFENHVDPENLRTLTFKKRLLDEEGNNLQMTDDGTLFSFRLYLSNGVDDTLNKASAVKYCVQDDHKKLCIWDAENQKFVPTEYSELHELEINEDDPEDVKQHKTEVKNKIMFNTSFNGSISKIPAFYTVLVPNLPVGTRFKVEERFDEIPIGYGRTEYRREEGSYIIDTDGDTQNVGRIRENESPRIDITNKRGYGIQANKIWSDKNYTKSHEPIYFAVYVGDSTTPLDGTVRILESTSDYVRYFFEELETGHTFDEYKIYEVKLTNPGLPDDDGVINSYTSIEKIENEQTTSIKATPSSSDQEMPFDYVVTYEQGEAVKCHADVPEENTRVDTITNTRSGGVIMNLYDMKTRDPLSGGTFTLKKATEEKSLGTFISDSNGTITILYDFEPGVEYILEETIAPKGYIGLPNKIKITLNDQDQITVDPNGNSADWQSGEQLIDNPEKLVAKVNVYNKPYTIQVYKYDKAVGEDDGELEGATFALYKGVKSGFGGIIKDSSPIPGYESLITNAEGIIPSVNNELEPGRYYLSEIAPPLGYKGIDGDVVFEITDKDGLIHISSPSGSGVELDESDIQQEYNYYLKIPNVKDSVPLTITKTVTGNMGSKVKDFTFTFTTQAGDTKEYAWSKNDEVQTTKLMTGNTFTMRHGDVIVITVSAGTSVTISEDTEGYTSSFKFNDTSAVTGSSLTFVVNDASTLDVTNNRNAEIPTGVWISHGLWLIAGAAILIFMLTLRARRRRLEYELKKDK
jgi:Predicted outer membrane protein